LKLIIAEKPMLVSAISDAIPGEKHCIAGSTWVTKGDYTLISVFGHLLTLKEPEDYDTKYADRNDMSLLPIYFEDWGMKVKPADDKHKDSPPEKRLNEIGRLLKECEYVVHAGDPDEEGQLLIDEILRWFNYQGRVYRLDTLDTTPEAMRYAMAHLHDNKGYESAGWSAYARSVADAMVGYNLSRYFSSLNAPALLPVGRVQTATMGLVCQRDALIEGHHKVLYYEVGAELDINGARIGAMYAPAKDDPNLEDGRILKRPYAETKAAMLRDETLRDVTVTRKTVAEQPPLPFNLSKLTSYCGRKFGYSPMDVMNITQSLRDNYKAISYNRTDCQYLTERQYEQSGPTMDAVIQNIGFKPKLLDMSIKSNCFSDKYTTDSDGAHTAIIPQAIQVDIQRMTEQERNVYLAICKYYMAQFLPPAKKEKSKLLISLVDGGSLISTATKTIFPGYLSIFKKDADMEPDDLSPLCSLSPGTYTAEVMGAEVLQKETRPPARYTQSSLAADMTCIAKYVDDPKAKALLREKDKDKPDENGSIGTPATRASIILGLINHGYLVDDGKHVISTQKAREFYRILPDEIKKADMTAYWWALQEDIRTGVRDYHVLTDSVLDTVTHIVHTQYPKLPDDLLVKLASERAGGTPLGACPRCGGQIVEGKKGFGCSNWRNGCKFVIWKTSKVSMLQKVTIKAANVKTWLSGGWMDSDEAGKKISVKSVHFKKLVSQKGSTFEGDLYLTDDPGSPYGTGFKLSLNQEQTSLGVCPRCGGQVQEFSLGYSCSNHKNHKCGFVIWKNPKGRLFSKIHISATDAKSLLAGKPVSKKNLVKKDGTTFDASLKLKDDPTSPYGADFELVFPAR
jgi:DNA topoisomerase-3